MKHRLDIDAATAVKPIFKLFKRSHKRFMLDLSKSSVIEILEAYQAKQKKRNPKYSLQAAISLLEEIQDAELEAANVNINDVKVEPFMPEDICTEFWVNFEYYFVNNPSPHTGKKRHLSSATTYSNQIIAALRWSQVYGVKLDPTFNDFKFERYEKKKITPSDDQISLIYHYDLTVKENRKKIRKIATEDMKMKRFSFAALERVRDHFVLSCSLGQRISDSKRLEKTNFTGDVYEVTQQKTGSRARVDIKECAIDYDVAKEILEKYDYQAPAYNMSTTHFNRYLHLLCRAIGGPFNKVVVWEYKELGVIKKETAHIYELMTSHVPRRVLITKLILKGLSISRIKSISGHRDIRNLNKYFAPEHQ